MGSKHIYCLAVLLCASSTLAAQDGSHPCDRECEWPAQPRTCEYDFYIEWYYTMSKACYNCPYNRSDCFLPDCVPADGVQRPLITVNRKFPMDTMRVCQNDNIKVNVHNNLDNAEGLAIHWHGLYMKETPYMDGVPMMTQCPIPVFTTFTYNFTADPPGTHWWHGHSGLQRSDGLAGPLIIKRAASREPHFHLYDEDELEHTIFIFDWLHQTTLTKFLAHHHSSGNNKGENILINGKGVFKQFSDPQNNTSYSTPREVFTVVKDKRYRFRTISNAALLCPMELTIQNHTMTIIASDGADIEPIIATSLVVNGGERFDFVLEANKNVSNYWMHVQGIADCRNQSQRAILKYHGAPEDEPRVSEIVQEENFLQLNPWNVPSNDSYVYVSALSAVHSDEYSADERYAAVPDSTHFIGFDFMVRDNPLFNHPDYYSIESVTRNNHLYSPQLNNISFSFPPSPILTQADDVPEENLCDPEASTWNRTKFCEYDFCYCPYVINIEPGSLVELVVYDEGRTFESGHPMHLHGQHFMVVAMDKLGSEISTEEMKEMHSNGSIRRSFNGILKDTVFVPDGGYTVVRFLADNPGVWFFHCHLIFHSQIGMELVFRVGKPHEWVNTPTNFPKCGSWHSERSGGTAVTHLPFIQANLLLYLALSWSLFAITFNT